MTEDELLDEIVKREGGFVNLPADRGGPTNLGITAATLGQWLGLSRPASVAEVKAVTPRLAKEIYRARYIEIPGLTEEVIPDEALRVALIDEAVISGPTRAIENVQRQLKLKADGIIGPETRAALQSLEDDDAWDVLVKVVRDRALRMVRIVERDATQLMFLRGWISRALSLLYVKDERVM